MRDHATFRVGLAMAAGALLAGCAGSTPSSSAPAESAAAPATPSAAPSSVSAPSTPVSSAPAAPSSAPAASSPSTALPTLTKPAKPPREPTDNLPATGWVAGMVTRGGTGPCYGLVADDGTQYALYSTEGIELTDGARVKVNLETTMLRIYCGPGKLMAMLEAEPIQ